jgi:anti-sigma regulatory factor (Ser/Thr protein kinase)
MPYHRCTACGLTSYSAAAYSSAGVCPRCLADLTDGSRLDIVPGVVHDRRFSLVVRPEAAAEARRALRSLALPQITREDLALLVSEMVTNSVRHAGLARTDRLGVKLAITASGVRLSVHDDGRGFKRPAIRGAAPLTTGGRGLLIIDVLSDEWGVENDAGGCTVWCELAVDGAETTRPLGEVALDANGNGNGNGSRRVAASPAPEAPSRPFASARL